MKAREGDLIETDRRLIFDVKGLVHPPNRVVAFIRYFPSETGARRREGKPYGKVYSLSERYAWLRKSFPEYLVYDDVFGDVFCEVPLCDVKKHFRPVEKLGRLRRAGGLGVLEEKALCFASLLKEGADVSWSCVGVSGSVLVGLQTVGSDVDLVVYGGENCRRVHAFLEETLEGESSLVRAYSEEDLVALFAFRSKDTEMGFEDFLRVELRKVLQGKFMGTDFFVRCVKDWSEVDEKYGDVRYGNVGYVKVCATVVDDSESIFTPCVYRVKGVNVLGGHNADADVGQILEVASFRGRFCEQARVGEKIVAQGKLEEVTKIASGSRYFRVLLGGKPSDFMVLQS
jgi:predicted nucleotidyltransferase